MEGFRIELTAAGPYGLEPVEINRLSLAPSPAPFLTTTKKCSQMKLEMKREALRSLNRQVGQEQGQASEEQGFGTFRASNSHFGNLQAPKGSFGSVGTRQRHTRPATLKLSVPARICPSVCLRIRQSRPDSTIFGIRIANKPVGGSPK